MSNSNLIPTAIVDKNGRQTTVHRRLDAPSSSDRRIPSISPSSVATKMTPKTIMTVLEKQSKALNANRRAELPQHLAKFSEDELNQIHKFLHEPEENVAEGTAYLVANFAPWKDIYRYATYMPQVDMEHKHHGDVAVRALGRYGLDHPSDPAEADENQVAQCVALLDVAVAIEESNLGKGWLDMAQNGATYDFDTDEDVWQQEDSMIEDKNLVSFVVENPELGKQIAQIIREQRVSHYSEIKYILDGISPALASGAL